MLMVLSAGGAKGLSAISYMNQVASERLKMYTCVCVYTVYTVYNSYTYTKFSTLQL